MPGPCNHDRLVPPALGFFIRVYAAVFRISREVTIFAVFYDKLDALLSGIRVKIYLYITLLVHRI